MVHNSFQKGLSEFGSDAESIVIDTFYFFKKSPCRKEDFLKLLADLEMDVKMFLKHGQTRWLTLIPAILHFKELLPTLKVYMKSLSNDQNTIKIEKYHSINIKLAKEDLLVQILFNESLKPLFDEFLTRMQTTRPQIHTLYSALVDVMTKLALRLLKPSGVKGTVVE